MLITSRWSADAALQGESAPGAAEGPYAAQQDTLAAAMQLQDAVAS
jgi:hypothetical protein